MSKAREQHTGGMFDRPGRLLAGSAVAVLLLWRIFTDSPNWHELAIGMVATALTITFLAKILYNEPLKLDLRGRDLIQLWRIPWYILSACWEITVVLVRDLAGRPAGSYFRDCGFRTSTHDPVVIGRTVLAVAYTTTSPNFIVIGIDPKQSLMLFHQIERSNVSKMTRALGAQA